MIEHEHPQRSSCYLLGKMTAVDQTVSRQRRCNTFGQLRVQLLLPDEVTNIYHIQVYKASPSDILLMIKQIYYMQKHLSPHELKMAAVDSTRDFICANWDQGNQECCRTGKYACKSCLLVLVSYSICISHSFNFLRG